MNIISINDLNFKYKDKIIFKNLNLDIKENTITTIMGKNGSGKTTLIKMLVGLIPSNNKIKFNDKIITNKNIKSIRKKIGIVFENPDNQFVGDTVLEDLVFTLENMKYKKKNIRNRVLEIVNYLKLENIVNEDPHSLTNNQKQLVNLASALIHEPKLLILDEAFTYLDPYDKDNIFNILQELKKEGLTIIIVTNDIEDTTVSDEIIVLNNQNVYLNGKKEEIYKEEKKLRELGFSLPFMVELSNRLKFYGLIENTIYDMKEMVDTLWK